MSYNYKESEILNFHHQIRSSLNVILGFINLLYTDNRLTKIEKEEYLKIIHLQSEKLITNLDEIVSVISKS